MEDKMGALVDIIIDVGTPVDCICVLPFGWLKL